MAYAMTKQGSLDNCITYEFICDTVADMNAIENRYRSIGSVAIVLQGESDGLEVYIAGSDKNWNSLSSAGADSSTTGGLSIYICGQAEVDSQTGLPDVDDPDDKTIYLVPAGNTSGNLYEEYIYINDAWEKFGVASIDLSNYIQKTDIATQSTAGLVKVLDNGNVTLNENNQLVLTLAGTAVVKTGQSDHPISVTHQHEATFYGLAKAAGQDMKNSDNAVGTYTTEAANAIRTMIGAGTYSKPVGGIPANDLAETYLTQHQDISGLYTKPAGGIPASDLAAGVIPDTSIYAPKASPVFTGSISLGRKDNTTIGANSVAEGLDTIASGNQSHAEGYGGTYTKDNINYTSAAAGMADHVEGYQCLTAMNQPGNHAEGYQTRATGGAAHSEGILTVASANATHAEGNNTTASGSQSHSEGNNTIASGPQSHSEGNNTTASGSQSHAEGNVTMASGKYSHSEGDHTVAQGINSHAEGCGGTYTRDNIQYTSSAVGMSDHTEGYQCLTTSGQPGNHAEGYQTQAIGGASHAEGNRTIASGPFSHAEGDGTTASGPQSHAEGAGSQATGTQAHAEGTGTIASGSFAHAEGAGSIAVQTQAHAEGASTNAFGPASHAEGVYALASGEISHAEGEATQAIGKHEHVSGRYNISDTVPVWTDSTSYQVGDLVSKNITFTDSSNIQRTRTVIYKCKTANSDSTFKSSKWEESGIYAEIIGNGTADNARSNARALDWNGNEHLMGDIYINCNPDSTGGTALGALVSGYESRISALEAEIASLRIALLALQTDTEVTLENGQPLVDEQGNLIEYDTPTT